MRSHAFLLLAITPSLLVACGGPLTYKAQSTSKAPGADAVIIADVKASEGKTDLEIKIEHLTPADRVCGGQFYNAWYKSKGPWVRVATLQFDASSRESESKMSVPEQKFELQITCEKEQSPSAPSNDVIFAQAVN